MKKPLPVLPTVAVIVLLIAGIGVGLYSYGGPSINKDVLLKARSKPGSTPASTESSYGRPRGTPIVPVDSNSTSDPRRRPNG